MHVHPAPASVRAQQTKKGLAKIFLVNSLEVGIVVLLDLIELFTSDFQFVESWQRSHHRATDPSSMASDREKKKTKKRKKGD
jgi:hypothetical protein